MAIILALRVQTHLIVKTKHNLCHWSPFTAFQFPFSHWTVYGWAVGTFLLKETRCSETKNSLICLPWRREIFPLSTLHRVHLRVPHDVVYMTVCATVFYMQSIVRRLSWQIYFHSSIKSLQSSPRVWQGWTRQQQPMGSHGGLLEYVCLHSGCCHLL